MLHRVVILTCLQVIAHKSSSKEILGLRKLFDQYDTANNGIISFEEFKAALEKSNYPEEQVTEIFESIVSVSSDTEVITWSRVVYSS